MPSSKFYFPDSFRRLPSQPKYKQKQVSASVLCTVSASAPPSGASVLWLLLWIVQIFLRRLFYCVISRFCWGLSCKEQFEEDGLMGHTRRSKQTSKSSSTVVCDSAVSLEDWKQQIKVKNSIPANQQRLIFTSQRVDKQPVALANFRWGRQWQIVLDASVDGLCDQLQHWQANFYSKNSTAQLVQPVVLNETDKRALTLHSRTAHELREVGVPCNVFFLSFNKWIPSGVAEEHTLLKTQPKDLDLKIDEAFREHTFVIDLYGELNGCRLSMPFSYVMNGREVAAKLLMLEQTACYREQQKQRYLQLAAPTLKDSDIESEEDHAEVNSWNSNVKDYVLEFEKNCEFTAFISKSHHRLRCIVLPVITIPLVEVKGSEEPSLLRLLNIDPRNGCIDGTSRVLSLPWTSQSEVDLISGSRSICEAPSLAPEGSGRKGSRKKKKRKGKRSQKRDTTNHAGPAGCEEAGKAALPWEEGYKINNVKMVCAMSPSEGAVVGNDLEHDPVGCKQVTTDLCFADMDGPVIHVEEGCAGSDVGVSCSQTRTQAEKVAGCTQEGNEVPSMNGSDSLDLVNNHPEHDPVGCKQVTTDLCFADMDDPVIHVEEGPAGSDVGVTCSQTRGQVGEAAGCTSEGKEVPSMNCSNGLDLVNKLSSSGADALSRDGPASTTELKVSKSKVHTTTPTNQSPNREVVDGYKKSSFQFLQNRGEHAGRHRDGFSWSRRPQDFVPYRSRTSHGFSNGNVRHGDSRSNAPFWRHQRNELDRASHSWSKPGQARQDDLPLADRVYLPVPRQSRNVPAWEQVPYLQQTSNGSCTRGYHWERESCAEFEEPWPKGQTYSSFNMHRRKTWRSDQNLAQQHPISGPVRDMPKYTMPSGMGFPEETSADRHRGRSQSPKPEMHSTDNHGSTCTDCDSESKETITEASTIGASVSYSNLQGAGAPTLSSVHCIEPVLQPERACNKASVPGPSSSLLPKCQVLEHVCGILEAVHASHEYRGFYEQVRSMNGHAMCEFEKVVKAVAPTVKAPVTLRHWGPIKCPCKNLPAGPFKSFHQWQAPDVPLRTLWEWYEEPSCYGLKVKLAESTRRLSNQLHAFFVPYLSAIQLFGWSSKESSPKEDDVLTESHPFHSGFLSEPIFSILLPRECSDDNSLLNQPVAKSRERGVDSQLGGKGGMVRRCHCGVELVYEFFEGEKPQQRKPLTERIKELASREVASEADAHMLTNANIANLHPSSWFAISWYPIYKIPDESFRAAFLTFHCLGCLHSVCPEVTDRSGSSCMDTLAAPVVGLMTYKAQAKEWFALTPGCHMEDHGAMPFNVDPSEALQQYLAKLEKAAASMARGSGDQSSGFKHSDFCFFQSRGN